MGLKNPQPVTNGDSRGENQKPPRKLRTLRVANGIYGLPGNQHGHHRGFSGTGGKFQGKTKQFGVGVVIGSNQMVKDTFRGFPGFWRDFAQPDNGFNGFNLAEKRADPAERMMSSMLKQPGSFRRDLPLGWLRQGPPMFDQSPHFVDMRSGVVLLLGR